ncbi:MAG: BamA/TamA family outer membrane protein [Bacteroidales bacterium]|nr:BamA/TamA family outer membrane protein [Bacteroidales bacterium]
MNLFFRHKILFVVLLLGILLSSCSVARFVPEDEHLLEKVSIVSDSSSVKTGALQGYVRQHPNSKWFNIFKVPLLPYALSSTDSAKKVNKFLWRIGEKPVLEDTVLTERCRNDIQSAVRNLGYLEADVTVERRYHKHKVDVKYRINPRERYKVGLIERDIRDAGLDSLLRRSEDASLLSEGMDFDVNVLNNERSRINAIIMNNGYYRFNREFIRFEADTTEAGRQAWLKLVVDPYRSFSGVVSPHVQYRVKSVNYDLAGSQSTLRKGVLDRVNHIECGKLYSEQDVQTTYSALGGLDAVLGSTIQFQPDAVDSTLLDANISITTNKPNSINAEVEGTNSAGDLGAALSVAYQNRNLFRGSEVLGLKLRGAFEAIKGLDGYDDQNYIEYSTELSLKFPDFIFPFLSKSFRRLSKATSEVSLMYDSQDRPEFHRRVVSGVWRYRWVGRNDRFHHRIDLIDLNYVYMPWISETFKKDYLDDPTSRNAILRYNYENLFIMKMGYNFSYSTMASGLTSTYGTNAYSIRFGLETAGNLLRGISSLSRGDKNSDGHYTVFDVAYAEYAKLDFDFSKSFKINERNSLALHFGLGVAIPYGNSNILPYEKRYFSGGANSVRGWSVRELGPGKFRGTDGRIDFINQTGDMKLDMNLEYRTHLFWKIDGAVFLDAGNVWTLRNYEDQPGGQFTFNTFWKEIAAAYGLGLRLNFNYFILRLDGGVKAINPAYDDVKHHYPIIHPNLKRDFSFHFAVGLPF